MVNFTVKQFRITGKKVFLQYFRYVKQQINIKKRIHQCLIFYYLCNSYFLTPNS